VSSFFHVTVPPTAIVALAGVKAVVPRGMVIDAVAAAGPAGVELDVVGDVGVAVESLEPQDATPRVRPPMSVVRMKRERIGRSSDAQ